LRTGKSTVGIAGELDAFRRKYDIDFVTLVDRNGNAVARSRQPFAAGDQVVPSVLVDSALKGTASSGTIVLSRQALLLEGEALAERAYIPLVYTERAIPTERAVEDRGMVLEAAIPVLDSMDHARGRVRGLLLNRKFSWSTGYGHRVREKEYMGKPVGTVTLFLGDVRVATNVMLEAGTRALGTQVSREVYHTVLVRRPIRRSGIRRQRLVPFGV
jgi:two-component system NtrC family sensor kinase